MITTHLNLKLDDAAIIQYCRDIVPAHRTKNYPQLEAQSEGFATWKSDTKPPALHSLLDIVETKLDILSGEHRPLVWWYVGLPTNARIELHDHNQSDYSAVYYPMDSEGGELCFTNGEVIEPKAGMLVCFPGDYAHYVRRYIGSDERISVVFNRVMK